MILLDAGPLGLVSNPRPSVNSRACSAWLDTLLEQGIRIFVPEIADYEVRRELIRAGKKRGLRRLDELSQSLEYLPITTATMRQAAELWAQARRSGQPTADDKALDGDVILAAQALGLGVPNVVIATTNVAHLSRFTAAAAWPDIIAS